MSEVTCSSESIPFSNDSLLDQEFSINVFSRLSRKAHRNGRRERKSHCLSSVLADPRLRWKNKRRVRTSRHQLSRNRRTFHKFSKPLQGLQLSSELEDTPVTKPKANPPSNRLLDASLALDTHPNTTVALTDTQQPSALPQQSIHPETDEPSEPPTDPHERGRKFLYRLAPLLKLTLPSRVERRRTRSVFDLQTQSIQTGDNNRQHQNNPTVSPRSGFRTTACEKQWSKHGTLIQHCLTFLEDKSSPAVLPNGSFSTGSLNTLALRNADLYVQRLWHELQLRVHGDQFERELGNRVFSAKKVIAQLVSFGLPPSSDNGERTENGFHSESFSLTPASYLKRIETASMAVSDLLAKADHVEQTWSSEARLTADVVDWVLPEVWSRLTCLRQWYARLLIIQRGLRQVCTFLHSTSSSAARCSLPHHRQGGSSLHELDDKEGFVRQISTCPLLSDISSPTWQQLCRQFLRNSWHLSTLPDLEHTSGFHVGFGEVNSSGCSVALIRLNRLIDRLLIEIHGNRLGGRSPLSDPVPAHGKATQTCSPIRQPGPTLQHVSSDLFQRKYQPFAHHRVFYPKSSSANIISVPMHPAGHQLQEPRASPSGVFSSSARSSPHTNSPLSIVRDQGNQASPKESDTLTWWQTLRRKLQQRSMPSYASVVKRRSWNGYLSPLEINTTQSENSETITSSGLPVKWEICSPSLSASPRDRSASTTPSPQSSLHRSQSEHSSSTTTSKTASDNSSSSNSSLNSFPQTRCALADSPSSTSSEGTYYWSVDLPDPHRSKQSVAGPDNLMKQDVGVELGLPPLVLLWLCIARIPFYVTREAVSLKLEHYAERVNGNTSPNHLNLAHLVYELRALLITSLRVTRAYRKHLVTALKLNTVAQIRSTSSASVPSWSAGTQTESDDSDGDMDSHCSVLHNVQPIKPSWFLHATMHVRHFLDDETSPTSLSKVLEAYADCLVRLLDMECMTSEGSPSDLRSLVEREWDFVRRVYRQVHRCRGGLHYAYSSGRKGELRTIELTFVRICRKFINFLSERFASQIGVWVRSAVTSPFKVDEYSKGLLLGEPTTPTATVSTDADSMDSSGFHPEQNGWLSINSSISIPASSGRNELFQEFNESWRGLRAWLNCLLDLTTVVCNDLDTSVMMNLTIPVSRKTLDKHQSAGIDYDATVTDSLTSKALRKLTRELRQMGHVLLYSWHKAASSLSSATEWNHGCVFIWSPFLQHASSEPLQASHTVNKHGSFAAGSRLLLASSETRRAVRKHISMLVHRVAKQLIFKPRKAPPYCLVPLWDLSSGDVNQTEKSRNHSRGPHTKPGAAQSTVEYLLILPGLPPNLWDGLTYNFVDIRRLPAHQSRSSHVRRSWYTLEWLITLCQHSDSEFSRHYHRHKSDLPVSITCWLMSDYPHAAWSVLRESSDKFRRWLALSSTLDPLEEALPLDQDSPGTRACSFQMAPILAELCSSVQSLRRNLCDLSAILQGSLLVMESHLRSYMDSAEPTQPGRHRVSDTPMLNSTVRTNKTSRSPSTRFAPGSRDIVAINALRADTVQRAFSVVFSFHKTLIRLMNTAPIRTSFQVDTTNPSGDSIAIHTRLVNLGVQLLRSWSDYVTSHYPRGRGRIPRWANDACHFAYRLCQPRSVKFLDSRKVASLETTLNSLIPHLVGERGDGESPTPLDQVDRQLFPRCHSAAIPGRISPTPHSVLVRPRRVHSLHGFVTIRRQLFNRHGSHKSTKAACKASPLSVIEDTQRSSNIQQQKALVLLAELDSRRDSQLRSLGLIGRTRPEQYDTPTLPTTTSINSPDVTNAGNVSASATKTTLVKVGRRHFPYTWNRGRLIGVGATGKVFQAFNLQTQEMMAVKEIHLDQDFDEESPGACPKALERLNSFRRECELLSNLSHPTLVRFLGADEQTPRVLRLFTELCNAGTLADVARDCPSEALIRYYARDLASAIVYLHERGIVHRDIKPSNIFLISNPTLGGTARWNGTNTQNQSRHQPNSQPPLLKLGDFSHSLRLHSFSSTAHGIAGTVCYMAPEVCRSSTSGYGKPCDIWSYCCVLLELITGKRPWYNVPEMHAVFYKLCCDEIPPLPMVKSQLNTVQSPTSPTTTSVPIYTSAEAFALLRAGLTPDPSKRPTAPELYEFCFVQSR